MTNKLSLEDAAALLDTIPSMVEYALKTGALKSLELGDLNAYKIEIDEPVAPTPIADLVPEITALFTKAIGVRFTDQQTAAILATHPTLIEEIEGYGGIDDIGFTNELFDLLGKRFLGRDWPHEAEGVTLEEFLFDIKTKAAQEGFDLIPHDYEPRPFRYSD